SNDLHSSQRICPNRHLAHAYRQVQLCRWPKPNANSYRDSDNHGNPHSNSHADTETNTNAKTCPDAETSTNACAASVSRKALAIEIGGPVPTASASTKFAKQATAIF